LGTRSPSEALRIPVSSGRLSDQASQSRDTVARSSQSAQSDHAGVGDRGDTSQSGLRWARSRGPPSHRLFISDHRQLAQVTTTRPQPARRQPPRSWRKARVTAATPRSALSVCSAKRWPWIPIGTVAMVPPQRSRNRKVKRAPSRYSPSPPRQPAGEASASLHGECNGGMRTGTRCAICLAADSAGERRAASRPSIRSNQGRKLGEGSGRKCVGTGLLLLNRLLK